MLAQGGYVTVTCTAAALEADRVPGYSTSPFLPSSV